MNFRLIFTSLFLVIVLGFQTASAQSGLDMLKAAAEFENERRFDDAIRYYERLIDSPDAAAEVKLEAKVRVGKIYLDVKGDIAKAQPYFEEGTRAVRFPELVALSMVYSGKAALATARTEAEFDRALSEFDLVTRAYPNTAAVVDALLSGGMVLELQRKLERAIINYQSIVFAFPDSPAAPVAFMRLGRTLARTGSVTDALKDYQNVQRLYAGQPVAAAAKEEATLIYRLFFQRGRTPNLFTPVAIAQKSEAFKLDDPQRIVWLPSGSLYIVDNSRSFVVSAAGQVGPGTAGVPDFVDDRGRSYKLGKKSVSIGTKVVSPFFLKGTERETLGDIRSAAANRYGELIVASSGPDGLFRVDPETGNSTPFIPGERKFQKILADSEDNFYLLDEDRSAIEIIDGQGKPVSKVSGVAVGIKEIVDFTIDAFDNLYILDKEGQFTIVGGLGLGGSLRLAPIHKQPITEQDKNEVKPVKNLRSIAVTPTGTVYVLGKEQVIGFR